MAGSLISHDGAWTRIAGRCWRAVAAGAEACVLDGTTRAGRYNRPGEPTLYLSGSPEGVESALTRYPTRERVLIAVEVAVDRLLDLRDAEACAVLGIDPARAAEDWIAALDRGETAPSWAVADRARGTGAAGLIDPARHMPGLWHLVLFRWGGATVRLVA